MGRDVAAGRRMLQMRNPRHVGFQRDDEIGVGQQRARLETAFEVDVQRALDAVGYADATVALVGLRRWDPEQQAVRRLIQL